MKTWLKRHSLFSFYLFAYAYSWAITVPLALQAQDVITARIPQAAHYLSAFGPMLAALTVSGILRGGETTQALASKREHSVFWLIVGFASPLVLFVAVQLAARIGGAPTPNWAALGRVNFLPDLGISAWFLWFLTSGLGEEIGWRGFALPQLQKTHSAFASSVLLSIPWAGWHLPAFFYVPSYVALGPRIVPGFFIGILAGSIVLTWLYNSSGGSVFAAVLWHASFNFVSASPNAAGLVAAVTSALVIAWAVVVLWRCGPSTLIMHSPRQRNAGC